MYKRSRPHDQDSRPGYKQQKPLKYSSPEPEKFAMKHQAMELYKVCINHDPGMTLTYFTTRPTSKIFFSKTTWPIKVKFYRKHLYEGGTNVITNIQGHMTKMATMPIYGKNPSKSSSQELLNLLQRKLICKN